MKILIYCDIYPPVKKDEKGTGHRFERLSLCSVINPMINQDQHYPRSTIYTPH